MVVAAFGYLPPVWGAILQELIDVAVILNALRALRDTTSASRLSGEEAALARRFSAEHTHPAAGPRAHPRRRRPARLARPGRVASPPCATCSASWSTSSTRTSRPRTTTCTRCFARVLGGNDPTATMSRLAQQRGL